MNSEKVKEIKEALEYCSNHSVSDCSNVCPYDKYTRCRTELTKDSLTLINELESENERLNKSDTSKEESSIEYYNLYRDFKRENQKLKDRIAELEDKIENGTLVELPCKGIEELDIIKKGMIFIFYKMCLEQNLGQGVFLKYKSKINEWFKSYLKNKELQEEQE